MEIYICSILIIFREQKIQKPKILSELIDQGYKVQEVNFFTMLSIVQSCQELQNQRVQGNLKTTQSSKFDKQSKKTNFFTVLKGIMPGKYYCLVHAISFFMYILNTQRLLFHDVLRTLISYRNEVVWNR